MESVCAPTPNLDPPWALPLPSTPSPSFTLDPKTLRSGRSRGLEPLLTLLFRSEN